jgi:hypothetical protein
MPDGAVHEPKMTKPKESLQPKMACYGLLVP